MLLPPFWRCCLILLTHQEKGRLTRIIARWSSRWWEGMQTWQGRWEGWVWVNIIPVVLVGHQNMKGFVTGKTGIRNLGFFSGIESHVHYYYSGAWKLLWNDTMNSIFFSLRSVIHTRKLFVLFIRKRNPCCLAGLMSASVSDPGSRALAFTPLHSLTIVILPCPWNHIWHVTASPSEDHPKNELVPKFSRTCEQTILLFFVRPCSFPA